MFFRTIAGAILAATGLTLAQVYDTQNSITAAVGTPDSDDPNTIGNHYNYWRLDANATTYDLTRSDRLPTTSPKTIPMLGSRPQALIEPNRTAFVIVDMQNFFLHPKLSPQAVRGRQAVQPTLNLIDAFRANGMKILWTNWGIDAFDLLTMPPGLLEGFSDDHQMNTTFCSDMGTVREEDGTEVALGGKLCRGAWNARPWAGLGEAMDEGLAAGTDLYFNKSKSIASFGACAVADGSQIDSLDYGARRRRWVCICRRWGSRRCSSAV